MAETHDQERTEEATPHRRREAREKGQVALSHDLVAVLSLAGAALILGAGGAALARHAGALILDSAAAASWLGAGELGVEEWAGRIASAAAPIGVPALLVVLALFAIGLLAGYGQVGFEVTPKALEWDVTRLSPASGWKRLMSSRSVARTCQSSIKIAFVGTAAGWAAWASLPELAALTGQPLGPGLVGVGALLARVACAAIGTFTLLAVFDALYQRWQHGRDLRMTREELRQELKTTEGDPHLRARIREIQRRMARQRMMADVPRATVVVTNPTHVAVALRWDRDEDDDDSARAPVVVAKGLDLVAQRIKAIAREHGVPLCEDVPLARTLHARCEIGQEIPTELYQAVAAVLAQVWNLHAAQRRGAEAS